MPMTAGAASNNLLRFQQDRPCTIAGMFTAAETAALLDLLSSRPVAALGTLHKGEPFVSMVPYVVLPSAGSFIIHVSSLATHTRDMVESVAVSLMVTALGDSMSLPQGLARATFQCEARPCPEGEPHHESAKRQYLSRFPQSEPMFGFGDFRLFALVPRYMRFVGGFAQARTVMAPELEGILAQAPASTA